MKLFYYCSSCQKENSFTTKASNRFELQDERGNTINERCKYCGNITKRHVNRVHAKANVGWIAAAAIVGIIAAILLFQLGWIASITFTLPFFVWQYLDREASKFNKIMVDDK